MESRRPTETVSLGSDEDPGWAHAHLQVGQVIAGRYQLLEVLGIGGFGLVYRAFDVTQSRAVALKILRADRCSPATVKRFMREAEIMRSLSDEHLIQIYDFTELEGTTALAMELVSGGTLRERLTRGPLAVEEAIRIGTELALGLSTLHAAGILHRDVKPGNVLFAESGTTKLGDLGLVLDMSSESTRLTTDGHLLGTLEYLSPEQALGEPLDLRSDLFSLGVVLYEMLTGRLPFEARSSLGSLLGRFHSRVEDPRRFRPEVPDWLARTTLRLLERESSERHASTEELIRDLEKRGSPRRLTKRTRRILGWSTVTALLAAFASLLAIGRGRSGFSHIVVDAPGKVRALAEDGQTLWRLAGPPISRNFETVRVGSLGRKQIAAILDSPDGANTGAVQHLSLLDAKSGATVKRIPLPDERSFFKDFAPTWSAEVRAFDVDGDARDEVFVTFIHDPYWPSYTVLVEPALERARTILVAGGHHRPLGAADVDGDSKEEVLFGGINNRAGHLHAIAAVRLVPPLGKGTQSPSYRRTAYTPNFSERTTLGENPLTWYAVLPSLSFDLSAPFLLDLRHRLILTGSPPEPILTFEGFPPDSTTKIPIDDRQELRWSSWRSIREADRSLASDLTTSAADAFNEAADLANRAGDPLLAQWARQREVASLVRGRRMAEAQSALAALFEKAQGRSEVAYSGAREFHRAGELLTALDWYRRALGPNSGRETTRSIEEILEGLLTVLAELGRFDQAETEVTRSGKAWGVLEERLETYRRYARWLRGDPVEPTAQTDEPSSSDLLRYWGLEFRRSSGLPASELLSRLRIERARSSSDIHPFLDGLEAELLLDQGERSEALARIRAARSEAPEQAAKEPTFRLLASWLEQRAAKIEAAAGS